MASPRKKDLARSSYPSARLVEWFRTNAAIQLNAHRKQIAYGVSVLVILSVVGGAWLGWRAYRTSEGLEHLRAGVLLQRRRISDLQLRTSNARKVLF